MPPPLLLAHIHKESGREQTLLLHSEKVATFCAEFCAKIGLKNLGELTGLLHDSGKATQAFQEYLQLGDESMRGEILHSFCGARYSWQTWGNGSRIKA